MTYMAGDSIRSLRFRLLFPLGLVCLITLIGTVGYVWLGRQQGATVLDALYMTLITITTVGYNEIIRLDSVGRIFTMFIAVTGIGSLFYSLTVVMDYLVSSRLLDPLNERKMRREVDKLEDHIIIAGLGRVGKQAAWELYEAKVPFVIIDPNGDLQYYAQQHGFHMVSGDASQDDILESSGIRRAKGLIVTTGDDANNLYIVLSARVMKPDLFIVSRAVDETSIPKLIRAGANRALSPYAIGGRRLAHLILSPTVVDFFDSVIKRGEETLNLEGIRVQADAKSAGMSLRELNVLGRTGAHVLVLLRGGQVLPNPGPAIVLQVGDQLLALGTVQQLDDLENLIAHLG